MPLGAARIALLAKTQVVAAAEVIRKKQGIQALGNAQTDTAISKFGGSSLLLDGSGDYLEIKPQNFSFGTGDFTIEQWIYQDNYSANYDMCRMNDASNNLEIAMIVTSSEKLNIYINGSLIFDLNNTQHPLNLTTWHHIALTRSSGTLRVFVDGTQYGGDVSNSADLADIATYTIGWNQSTGFPSYWDGNIDEVRISDTARYTTGFTAPTAPFTNDDDTLLLLHMDGTDASTYFEDDNGVGRSAVGITALGNAQVDTAQYKFGGASLYATQDGLIAHSVPNLDGDFTIEGWMRRDVTTSADHLFTIASSPKLRLAANSGTASMYLDYNDGGSSDTSISTTVNATTWYHFAVVRASNVIKIYQDGTQIGTTYSDSIDYSGEDFYIGSDGTPGGAGDLTGHIDEFRVSNTARYTSAFTAPTAPFVNDSNTLLLMHMDGTDARTLFRDDNGTGRSAVGIQANGNAQIDTAQSKFGGSSALFDGTDDYLFCDVGDVVKWGTYDEYTIEFWIRTTDLNSLGTTSGTIFPKHFGNINDADTGHFWSFGLTYNEYLMFQYFNGSVVQFTSSALTVSTNTWYHISFVKNSTNLKLFFNGTEVGSTTVSGTPQYSTTNGLRIGELNNICLNGHLDEIRISDTARYTTGFTPSTEPFQNDSNTLLLVHCDGTDGSTDFTDDNGVTTAGQGA